MSEIVGKIHIKRKILSLSIIGLAVLFFYLPDDLVIRMMVSISIIFVFLDFVHYKIGEENILTRLYFKLYPKKPHEYKKMLSDASIFFLSTLIMVIVFPKEIVAFSVIIFIVADIVSHVFGIIFHQGKLFWNQEKTWGGVLPSFFSALLVGYLIVKLVPHFDLNFLQIAVLSATIALFGTLDEFDNLAMPWSYALLLSFFV